MVCKTAGWVAHQAGKNTTQVGQSQTVPNPYNWFSHCTLPLTRSQKLHASYSLLTTQMHPCTGGQKLHVLAMAFQQTHTFTQGGKQLCVFLLPYLCTKCHDRCVLLKISDNINTAHWKCQKWHHGILTMQTPASQRGVPIQSSSISHTSRSGSYTSTVLNKVLPS